MIQTYRRRIWGILLPLFVLVLFFLSLSAGSVIIPLREIVRIICGFPAEKSSWEKIVLLFRLPKALTALLAGSALACSGLLMQTLFRNPLAGPSVLGINAGAGLGVALTVLAAGSAGGASGFLEGFSFAGQFSLALSAAAGAGAVLFLIMIISAKIDSIMTLLIIGILFGYAAEAGVSVLMHLSVAERVQAYMFWSFGSFSSVAWESLGIFAFFTAMGIIIGAAAAKQLNALLLGEQYAHTLGVKIRTTRFIVITATALLAGSVTAFCGPITFVGIAVPHLARGLFKTSDHRVLFPFSAFLGSAAALLADLISQVPGKDMVFPLNSVTSLLGAPIIIWVIIKRKNLQEGFGG